MLGHAVTISSPIVQIYSQVADLGSACKLAPQSLGLPHTERLSMGELKSILKLREVSPLAWELDTGSRKGQVTKQKKTNINKHKQTPKRSVNGHLTSHMIAYL